MFPFGYGGGYGGGLDPYARAIAEERAARRAEQEAHERAARARLAQQQMRQQYGQPYSSFLGGDDPYGGGYYEQEPGYYSGYGAREARERAYMEAMREQQRAAQLRQLEMEQREEQRRREIELQRALEAERRRKEVLARELERQRQQRAAEEEEERRRRRRSVRPHEAEDELEQFYHALGLPVPRRAPRRDPERTEQTVPLSQRARTQPPTSRVPAPAAAPASAPTPSKPTAPSYTPEQAAAAETIQAFYRTNAARKHALASISELDAKFTTVKSSFVPPPTLDFLIDGHPQSVPTSNIPLPPPSSAPTPAEDDDATQPRVPKLAFTPANVPLHAYDEELNRLLGRLDAIESGGDAIVREHRRALVRAVEAEAQRVERWRAAVWVAHTDSAAPQTGDVMSAEDAGAQDAFGRTISPGAEATTDVQLSEEPADVDTIVVDAPLSAHDALERTLSPGAEATADVPLTTEPADVDTIIADEPVGPSTAQDAFARTLSPASDAIADVPLTTAPEDVATIVQPSTNDISMDDVTDSLPSIAPAASTSPLSSTTTPEAPSTNPSMNTAVAERIAASLSAPSSSPHPVSSEYIPADVPLPLTTGLAHTHAVDPSVPVSAGAQAAVDEGARAHEERAVHRGVAAELDNVPRTEESMARALGAEPHAGEARREETRAEGEVDGPQVGMRDAGRREGVPPENGAA